MSGNFYLYGVFNVLLGKLHVVYIVLALNIEISRVRRQTLSWA